MHRKNNKIQKMYISQMYTGSRRKIELHSRDNGNNLMRSCDEMIIIIICNGLISRHTCLGSFIAQCFNLLNRMTKNEHNFCESNIVNRISLSFIHKWALLIYSTLRRMIVLRKLSCETFCEGKRLVLRLNV